MKRVVAGLVMVCLILIGFAMAEMPKEQKALYEGIPEVEAFDGVYRCGEDFKDGSYIIRVEDGSAEIKLWFTFEAYKQLHQLDNDSSPYPVYLDKFEIDSGSKDNARIAIDGKMAFTVKINSGRVFIQPER